MEEADAPFEKLEACIEAVRTAVEERNYPTLELALREQRALMSSAPASDPRTQIFALKGSALISWALTTVKIQHAGYAQELATSLNFRHLNEQYGDERAPRHELLSVKA